MSKLILDLAVPKEYDRSSLAQIIRILCGQVNALSEGRISAQYQAQSSVPSSTQVAYAVGDFIADLNSTVRSSVAPGVAANYVREGWRCVAPGTGATATFVEVRTLTGT